LRLKILLGCQGLNELGGKDMSNIAIVVDSTAYIPEELVKKYKIHVIPQILNWGEHSFLDGIDIKPTDFYQRLQVAADIPTTSQPSAGDFFEFLKKVNKKAENILAILISDQLSGTLDSACSAREMLPGANIEIVDSMSTSMGLGWIALAAARAAEEGKSFEEVGQLAQSLIPKSRIVFVVDTLEYLHKGGRIGGAKRLMGSLLSVKPLLHLQGGRIEPLASPRTKEKAIAQMLDIIEGEVKDKTRVHMAIINALAQEDAASLMEIVQSRFNPVELFQADMSPVISTHVGPGTVGVAWLSY
jgi:DegV family protein with EDD domain